MDQIKKKKWDGSWKDAYKCDNMVQDYLEHGRIFRESTPDGYTHDLVDRGDYLSEDYYFPDREGTRGKIHYEIHSDGVVLKNGKPIKAKRGGTKMAMKMKMGKELGQGLDLKVIRQSMDQHQDKLGKLGELGEKFNADKEMIEDKIESVKRSKMSAEHKSEIIAELEDIREQVREQYERDVAAEEAREQEELQEDIEKADEASQELQEQAESMRSAEMAAASATMDQAVGVTEKMREEFDTMRDEVADMLSQMAESAQQLSEKIHSNGRRQRPDV